MKRIVITGILLALLVLLFFIPETHAQDTGTSVVQAVLFYSESCPHCHEVIEIHLPPIKDKYGNQFQIIGVDTSLQVGAELYEAAVVALNISQDRLGVPLLVVGDVTLVGSREIPEELPSVIENGLASGGIGWPEIPGLYEAFPELPSGARVTEGSDPTQRRGGQGEEEVLLIATSQGEAPAPDRVGFAVGWAVLSFCVVSLAYAAVLLLRSARNGHLNSPTTARLRGWTIPILSILGLGVAGYLAYVEILRVEAVCGPVGECNVVQSSEYAFILGIPVAVLGVLFYLSMLGLWLFIRLQKQQSMDRLPIALVALAFLGTVFSIYLTVLELLVIRAVCAWCLTSAVITTLLLLLTASPWRSRNRPGRERRKVATQTR